MLLGSEAHMEFSEIITSEGQIRDIIGQPFHNVVAKTINQLDEHCQAFIAKSPFMLLASADARGNMDVSPKGDPPGFVHVLDDHTLVIPDRIGNRRVDTMKNILQNPKVGLLFLIPGKSETLRVSGTAVIVRDQWVREPLMERGKIPDFAIVVTVQEAFAHCAKCIIRSKLWEQEQWPSLDGLASLACMMVDHGKLSESVEEMQAIIDRSYRERLY
jgi:PPOX class probable FMN-dependent enzyme